MDKSHISCHLSHLISFDIGKSSMSFVLTKSSCSMFRERIRRRCYTRKKVYSQFDRPVVEHDNEFLQFYPSERSHYGKHWDRMMATLWVHPKKNLVEKVVLSDFHQQPIGSKRTTIQTMEGEGDQYLMFFQCEY